MHDVMLARQPIFDRNLDVHAYELLFRRPGGTQAEIDDGDLATSKVIVSAFVDLGAERVLGDRPAFINLTDNLIRTGAVRMLPKERVVLEILEDVTADEELVRAVKGLKQSGFTVAVDDFTGQDELRPLLDIADIVKIDVMALGLDGVRREASQLQGKTLLAEKVETHEEFEVCKELGFEYFQGYFLCRPKPISGRAARASRMTLLRLLSSIHKPDVTTGELEKIIRQDVALSYGLLRILNSAYYTLPRKVENIRHALNLLGLNYTRQWISLLAMAGVEDKPPELFVTAMVRARMAEQLARSTSAADVDQYFVTGLFSILDALMDKPMERVVRELPLAEPVKAALLERDGQLGRALDCVLAQEQCRWEDMHYAGLDEGSIQEAYLDAITWTAEVRGTLAA